MKWLIVHPGPEFSVHDVYMGWVEALMQAGERVHVFNMQDRLTAFDSFVVTTGKTSDDGYPEFRKAFSHEQVINLASEPLLAACMAHWPDVVLIVSGFFVPPQVIALIRARGMRVVLLMTEAPYEDQRQLKLAPHADVVLLNDPVTIGAYRDVCPVTQYVPHAYRPSVHYPQRSGSAVYDLAFAGTGYLSRVDFFHQMRLDGLQVALAGNWIQLPEDSPLRAYLVHDGGECIDNNDTATLYRKARAGINFYRREADADATNQGWAMGPREVEMAACGLWFLRDPRPESDEILPMLPVFADPAEAGEILRWHLARDHVRDKAATSAREAVAGRTFRANAEMLLRLLDRQPVTI